MKIGSAILEILRVKWFHAAVITQTLRSGNCISGG
jgi:hypothetical protein